MAMPIKREDVCVISAWLATFQRIAGWQYNSWDKSGVGNVIEDIYPHILYDYIALPHAMQQVGVCEYIIADVLG